MEFEDGSQQIEWEARRVAIAFVVEEWECFCVDSTWHCIGKAGTKRIEWQFCGEPLRLTSLAISQKGRRRTLAYFLPHFGMRSGDNDTLLARGLYCLGVQAQEIPQHFPVPSAHEKLELRLAMPREFWPKEWLDEEENPTK